MAGEGLPALRQVDRAVKAKLLRCGLSMAELCTVSSGRNSDVFEHTHPNEKLQGVPTQLRGGTSQHRSWVFKIFRRIVRSMAAPVDLLIDEPTTDAALARFQTEKLDGHDLFLVEVMVAAGVTQVLTDDGDFWMVPGIQVFTANRPVLAAASTRQAGGALTPRGSGRDRIGHVRRKLGTKERRRRSEHVGFAAADFPQDGQHAVRRVTDVLRAELRIDGDPPG